MEDRHEAPVQPATHAKVRILDTANRLFYNEGVHSVGIDRIIAEAGVTKTTLYKYYRSKELLTVSYLQLRDNYVRDIVARLQAQTEDPIERLHLLVEAIAGEAEKPDFRGCPFINATAQFSDPQHPVRLAIAEHRRWYSEQVEQMFRNAGHPDPVQARDDFFLARDGAYASANLGDPATATAALRRMTGRLIGQASGGQASGGDSEA
ncbi:TetR/AcrR family transcriptional regulator [Microterricola pindariensis]|uniref:HTH tetR-type domain-containing protein n=1 Tax=Microterricola pindariensis TaxID=478010 RepID=A0ABX5AXY5_9MICO|nr:TetR/AcrR family transcriptional regulator [Microterricola pindariensis]PPL19251.1 hypothetical protein GY24_06645 [Microterricola pindariensis]